MASFYALRELHLGKYRVGTMHLCYHASYMRQMSLVENKQTVKFVNEFIISDGTIAISLRIFSPPQRVAAATEPGSCAALATFRELSAALKASQWTSLSGFLSLLQLVFFFQCCSCCSLLNV